MILYTKLIAAAAVVLVTVTAGAARGQVTQDSLRPRMMPMPDKRGMRGMMRVLEMGGMEDTMRLMDVMDGCLMMSATGPGALLGRREALGLTDAQVARLEALRDSARAALQRAMVEMAAGHKVLDQSAGAARAILTPEQREKLNAATDEMTGQGAGMTHMLMMMRMMMGGDHMEMDHCPMMRRGMGSDSTRPRTQR